MPMASVRVVDTTTHMQMPIGIGTRYKAPHYNHFNSNDFIECPSS